MPKYDYQSDPIYQEAHPVPTHIKNTRPMFCAHCGGKDIRVEKNVGWDIDEAQHVDICNNCGYEREWVNYFDAEEMKEGVWWSEHWKAPINLPYY